MNVYIVHTTYANGPDSYQVHATNPEDLANLPDNAVYRRIYERELIGYDPPQVEPCPELPPPELLGEVVEFTPQPQVSVVIDVAAILSRCATRDGAAEFIGAVLAAARS